MPELCFGLGCFAADSRGRRQATGSERAHRRGQKDVKVHKARGKIKKDPPSTKTP